MQETITSMFLNPFSDMELVSLSSGVVTTEKVTSHLLAAEGRGETEMLKFIDERLVNQTTGNVFHNAEEVNQGEDQWKDRTQSDIFGKIALIQQTRKLDLKEVFCYPLGPIPWSIATSAGELMITSKSALMRELEKGLTRVEMVQMPFAGIIHGMALVRKLKHVGLTFDEFADAPLKFVVTSSSDACRIDIVSMFILRSQSRMKRTPCSWAVTV